MAFRDFCQTKIASEKDSSHNLIELNGGPPHYHYHISKCFSLKSMLEMFDCFFATEKRSKRGVLLILKLSAQFRAL